MPRRAIYLDDDDFNRLLRLCERETRQLDQQLTHMLRRIIDVFEQIPEWTDGQDQTDLLLTVLRDGVKKNGAALVEARREIKKLRAAIEQAHRVAISVGQPQ